MFDYEVAKQIIKDVPNILSKLERSRSDLKQYLHYRDIQNVIDSIDEAKMLLSMHLNTYKDIHKKKGLRDG